jgi:hypothetical protein
MAVNWTLILPRGKDPSNGERVKLQSLIRKAKAKESSKVLTSQLIANNLY